MGSAVVGGRSLPEAPDVFFPDFATQHFLRKPVIEIHRSGGTCIAKTVNSTFVVGHVRGKR